MYMLRQWCSLSMLYRTCKNMHECVELGGLHHYICIYLFFNPKYGIQTHLKGNRNIKNILVSPKDKESMKNKSGVIYWFHYGELVCDEEYIGETSSTFGERFKEHLKEHFPIHSHSCITGHTTIQDNPK